MSVQWPGVTNCDQLRPNGKAHPNWLFLFIMGFPSFVAKLALKMATTGTIQYVGQIEKKSNYLFLQFFLQTTDFHLGACSTFYTIYIYILSTVPTRFFLLRLEHDKAGKRERERERERDREREREREREQRERERTERERAESWVKNIDKSREAPRQA